MTSKRIFSVTIMIFTTTIGTAIASQDEDHKGGEETTKDGRVLGINLFSVVRFPNGVCSGNNGQNGTCYATDECQAKGGSAQGSCASGYGSCCIFSLGCGDQASENSTYFKSVGKEVGQCRARICKCNENICQLRLDLESFTINGPSTDTNAAAKVNAAKSAATATQCLQDRFTVTSPGFNPPPTICGTNTGEHMYVDASDKCNELAFNFQEGTSTVTRTWSIRVTQYDCSYSNLAPQGCTQYFYGATSGLVRTYNFDGGIHLADQDQNICVRRERSYCRICWTTQAEGDFETSTAKKGATGVAKFNSHCCGYGTKATNTATGYDCALIPSATHGPSIATKSGKSSSKVNGAYGFCGGELGTASASIVAKTICSKKVPFSIRFLSDHYENVTTKEAAAQPNGFRLIYQQKAC